MISYYHDTIKHKFDITSLFCYRIILLHIREGPLLTSYLGVDSPRAAATEQCLPKKFHPPQQQADALTGTMPPPAAAAAYYHIIASLE